MDFEKHLRVPERGFKLADRDQSVYGALLFGTKFAGTKIFQNNGDVVNPSDDRKAAFAQPPDEAWPTRCAGVSPPRS